MALPETQPSVVGIDFGTAYSCVGVMKNSTVDIVVNDMGKRTTPSYVAFTEDEKQVGQPAFKRAARNTKNTIYDIKRILGKKFSDPQLQEDMKKWPFKIISDGKDRPLIQVIQGEEVKTFRPEEIAAMLLTKMKETAQDGLGGQAKECVLSVPAYFNEAQREAILNAAELAGLNVIRTIKEPVAAAYAYGLQELIKEEGGDDEKTQQKTVLVYDLGAGTLDVSVLEIGDGVIEVLSVGGDSHLGGQDFDTILVDHFAKHFERKEKLTMSNNKRSMKRLRTEVEKAKRILSVSLKASLEVDSLYDGLDFHTVLGRAKFEMLCNSLFKRCLMPLQDVLNNSGLEKEEIDEVILVGGASKMPKIKKLLSNFFNGKELKTSIDPDEAVAFGATALAASLAKTEEKEVETFDLIDVLPHSIGIETADGIMCKVIQRNQKIPCEATMIFTTYEDGQRRVLIKVYEGERIYVKDNKRIGKFWIKGIKDMPRGVPQICITFRVNEDCVLEIIAKEKISAAKFDAYTIDRSKEENLTREEMQELHKEYQKHEVKDKEVEERINARNLLENLIYGIRNELCRVVPEIDDDVNKFIEWMNQNQNADAEIFAQKLAEVQAYLEKYITKQGQETNTIELKTPNPLEENAI